MLKQPRIDNSRNNEFLYKDNGDDPRKPDLFARLKSKHELEDEHVKNQVFNKEDTTPLSELNGDLNNFKMVTYNSNNNIIKEEIFNEYYNLGFLYGRKGRKIINIAVENIVGSGSVGHGITEALLEHINNIDEKPEILEETIKNSKEKIGKADEDLKKVDKEVKEAGERANNYQIESIFGNLSSYMGVALCIGCIAGALGLAYKLGSESTPANTVLETPQIQTPAYTMTETVQQLNVGSITIGSIVTQTTTTTLSSDELIKKATEELAKNIQK